MAKKKTLKSQKSNKETDVLNILNSFRVDEGTKNNLGPLSDLEVKPKRKYYPLPEYIKISTKSKQDKFVAIGNRVEKKELKWSFFTTENNLTYHYYEVLK